MATDELDRVRPARKLAGERMGTARHVSLPMPLDERLVTAAAKLHVSRSLLLREAVARGLKPAVDALRRERRRPERQSERQGERAEAGK